jgi:hypothetical protein
MQRAGYDTEATGPAFWMEMRHFLTDLQGLCGPFALVAGGYRGDKQQWRPLDQLIDMTHSQEGQRWLGKCRLKVFGPEDYLVLWRRHFAREMGFSFIPGGNDRSPESVEMAGRPTRISSAVELDAWMRQQGLTNRALADKLQVSVAQVGSQRSGGRPWSADFEEQLAALPQSRDQNA